METDEKLSQKYAFNINKIKNKKRNLNMIGLNIQKGFYDEIEKRDSSIKSQEKELKKIKNHTLKEFIFTNQEIPEQWKIKNDYQDSLIKMLADDKKFLSYIGRGKLISNKPANNHNEIESNYSKNKNNYNNNEKPFNKYCPFLPFKEKTKNSSKCLKEESSNENLLISKGSNNRIKKKYIFGKKEMTEKEIMNVLDEVKSIYPISKTISEGNTKSIREQKKCINNKNKFISFDKSRNINKNLNKTLLSHHFKVYPVGVLGREQKKISFCHSIYSNLVPSTNQIKLEEVKKIKGHFPLINEMKMNKKLQKYLISINSNDERFNRTVIIKDPLVKKHLESINYFGPYFSFCPSCRSKNLEFYNNIEQKQCIEIIQNIKKSKSKNIMPNKSIISNNQKLNEIKMENNHQKYLAVEEDSKFYCKSENN